MPLNLTNDWALIVHHNVSHGFFPSNVSALFSLKKETFSVVSRIHDRFKINNTFEFILYYPDIDEYCHWKQIENPWTVDDMNNITFYPIDCKWENLSNPDQDFHGLRKSLSWHSVIDSTTQTSYFYAVGMYLKDSKTENLGLPGPQWGYKNTTLWEQYLYMKVEDKSLLKYLYSTFTKSNDQISFHLSIMSIIMIETKK